MPGIIRMAVQFRRNWLTSELLDQERRKRNNGAPEVGFAKAFQVGHALCLLLDFFKG